MSRFLVFLGLIIWPTMSLATDAVAVTPVERWQADHSVVFSAEEVSAGEFLWIARPVIVFGDSEFDPRFVQQMALIEELPEELATRDVVIITDSDPAVLSDIRKEYRPRGFMLVLVGKDGSVYLRKPFPWDVRELSRSIDKMPLRQQEIRDRRGD